MLVETRPEVPRLVRTDAKRYKQILFNLIGNAIKFTFEGAIKVVVSINETHLVTTVEDTGIGIKEDEL